MLRIDHIQDPNRLWALPVVSGLIKVIIVIPVGIWLMVVRIAAVILSIINSLVVLITGTYWEPAYVLAAGSLRLTARANCFVLGLSDTYPGFSLRQSDEIRLAIAVPAKPNRLLAAPFAGGIFRFAVLAPMFIFMFVLGILVVLVYWFAWLSVILMGQYPEGLFGLMVFTQRLRLRLPAYAFGLSDTYPLFDDEGLSEDEWGPGRHDRVFRPLGPDTFG